MPFGHTNSSNLFSMLMNDANLNDTIIMCAPPKTGTTNWQRAMLAIKTGESLQSTYKGVYLFCFALNND